MEVLPSELDLFAEKPFMLAVTDSEVIETAPLNSLDNTTSLDFSSLPYIDKFKDLQNIFLKLKLKVLKKDGTAYVKTDTTQPYLVPNICSSLFKSCFISIQSTPVNGYENNYHYKDFIECGLSYNKTTLSSRFAAQMYDSDATEDTLKKYSENSALFEVFAKVNVGSIQKLLLPGVGVTLRFVMENPDFYFMESDATSSILKIVEARLYIKHINVSNELILSIEKNLNSGKVVKYQYKRAVIVSTNVPAGISSLQLSSMWTGLRPSLALFFMCKHKSTSGDRTLMPFQFMNFGLNSFSFVLDGALRPSNSYKISVEDEDKAYAHIFSRLHESLGFNNTDRSCAITPENFKDSYFIIGEDLTRFSTSNSEVLDPLSQTTLGVQGNFAKPLADPVSVFLYLLIDTEFQIDRNRSVTLVY